MKKIAGIVGSFTKSAGKLFKGKGVDRVFCQIADGGDIYLSEGHVVFHMTAEEYAATFQPVLHREAGDWIMEAGGAVHDRTPHDMDIIRYFSDTCDALRGSTLLSASPIRMTIHRNALLSDVTACAYYNPANGAVCLYNDAFISALSGALSLHSVGFFSPAVACDADRPVAVVLPIRPEEPIVRAVKAYFTAEQTAEDKGRAELRETIAKQAAELDALRAELDKLHAEQVAAPVEQAADEKPAEDVKSAAEVIAARFSSLEGVRATIKGARTSAPVVWLSGTVDKYADDIVAAGAQWSRKRSAYYVRVA